MPIRLKLTAALAAPLVLLLTVVVAQISDTTRRLHQELDQAHVAVAAIGPSGLMSGLQDERSWALIELIGQEELIVFDVRGYGETRRRTDAAIAEFRTQIAASGGIVAEAYQPAIDGLDDLTAIRRDIDANDAPRTLEGNADFADVVFRRYAALITAFNEGNSRVALAVDDASLRQGAELVDLISRQIETSIQLKSDIIDSALPPDPAVSRDEIRAIATSADRFRRQVAAITTGARGRYRHMVEEATPTEWNERALAAADDAALRGEVDIGQVLSDAALPEAQAYLDLRERIADELDGAADDLAASARARVLLLQALGVLAMIVAALAVWRVSRSITRPLHALTRQAVVVAHERLPEAVRHVLDAPLGDDLVVPQVEPVTVPTRDEVADVADAINVVQASAIDLAVGQAVLRRNIADSLVNLGRRNQSLLGRQLAFITELMASETDTDVLADLFRLDHLATRMRRNAASLLLLAGVEPSRRWSEPVRLTDAIRAALVEVEDYRRVVDRGVEPTAIVGSAAPDVTHLLAELIDNSLIYSPPDQAVEMRGRLRPDGYTLTVMDAGLGMRSDELERANLRLAAAESFASAPSRYLGHFVAGILAARHAIRVTLQDAPGTGVTATITFPTDMLAGQR